MTKPPNTQAPAYAVGSPIWVMRMVNKAKSRTWQAGTIHHYREDKSADGVDVLTVKLGNGYLKLVSDGAFTTWRKYRRPVDYEVSLTDPNTQAEDEHPTPCEDCGSTNFPDWTLLPHERFNEVCPGGNGYLCLPCFAKRLVHLRNQTNKESK